jgi:hypothetical protein
VRRRGLRSAAVTVCACIPFVLAVPVAAAASGSVRTVKTPYIAGGAVTGVPIEVVGGGTGGESPITGQPYGYSYNMGAIFGARPGETTVSIGVADNSGLPVAARIITSTGQSFEACGVKNFVLPVTSGEGIGIWAEFGVCADHTPSVPTQGVITAAFTTPPSS